MRGSSFRQVDDRRLGERLEPLLTQLGPDTGLLRAGVGDVRSEIEMLVHPDRAGIEPGRHLERPVAVRRPDRAAQAKVRVVGTGTRPTSPGSRKMCSSSLHPLERTRAGQPAGTREIDPAGGGTCRFTPSYSSSSSSGGRAKRKSRWWVRGGKLRSKAGAARQ